MSQDKVRTMSDVRHKLVQAALEQNTQTITYTTNAINDAAGELNPSIPKNIFVKYFLPMFANEPKNTYPETAPQEWMRISVQGMSRVNVLDDWGKTVAVVPARYARSLVRVRTERNSVSLVDSMQTFSDLASSSPPRAMAYFHNVIMPTSSGSEEFQATMDQYIKDLKTMLEYFGKNTDFLNTTGKTNEADDDEREPQQLASENYSDDELL